VPGIASFNNPANEDIVALDTNLAAVVTNTGNTATNVSNVPAGIQTMGAPPYIPNLSSYARDDMTPATYTLNTFASASRLWYGSLSLALATDGTYASGLMRVYAQVLLGGNIIMIVQGAIGDTGEAITDHCDFSFGGLPIAATTAITVNVNNGTGGITGLYIAGAAVVMTSTP
jgi:hypothetical protein